jgi:hypothetical protein
MFVLYAVQRAEARPRAFRSLLGPSRRSFPGRPAPPANPGRGPRLFPPPRLPPGDDAGDLRRGEHERRRALSLLQLKAEIIGAIAEDKHADTDSVFLEATHKGALIDALSLLARDFFEKFAEGDGALIADIFAEAIRDEAVAAPLLKINQNSVEYCVAAIKAAQGRGEIDEKLDPRQAANTLFAAIEGIALRRAFLRDTDPDAAVAQFRALAQRYLSRQ